MIPNEIRVPLQLVSLENTFRGRVRLQKLTFLTNERYRGGLGYKFEPAPLGPVSRSVSVAILRLRQLGLIEEKIESTSAGHKVFCYEITNSGRKLVKVIKENNDDVKLNKAIDATYKKYGNMKYMDLLDLVHKRFPQYHLSQIKL